MEEQRTLHRPIQVIHAKKMCENMWILYHQKAVDLQEKRRLC